MRDDLISRKTLLETLSSCKFGNTSTICDSDGFPTHISIVGIMKIISNQPTAFDKEKVISQIQEKSYWESWSKVIDTNKAVWIVEKGGIE